MTGTSSIGQEVAIVYDSSTTHRVEWRGKDEKGTKQAKFVMIY